MYSKPLKLFLWFFLLISEGIFAWQPHNIIVFGDNLSDNGNKYQAYHIPASPPYWNGRYSNGPVWVENLAYQFNLIPNPLTESTYSRNIGLQDYAIGDSTVLEKNLATNSQTLTLLQQLKQYQSQPHGDLRKTLVIIWDGSNDYKTASCQASPFSCTKDIIHTQMKLIDSLYEFGIRHFLILSLPNLAITPQAHEYADREHRVILSGLIKYYNNNLALAVSQLQLNKEDIHIAEFDVNEFIQENKQRFNQPIYKECYINHNIYNKAVGTPCPAEAQSHYFFWDELHPTATVHAMLAEQIYEVVKHLEE